MKKGLVIGKFQPLHKGHLSLIAFAAQHCDLLYVLLCYTEREVIPGPTRLQWLQEELNGRQEIKIIPFGYNENELANTSVSSKEVSAAWAVAIRKELPDIDIIFSSEPYGDYLAEYLQVSHLLYDQERKTMPVSGSSILTNPFQYWSYIAEAARPYFVKKIVLLGSESTGKSTLTEKLARNYHTAFVPEMAREIIEKTEECTVEDLYKIATLHAGKINSSLVAANRLLFIDTDITITQSYALFLFGHELITAPWIEEANRADLYFYLETDCPFVQDGTRLDAVEREKLSRHHKQVLQEKGIDYISITGNWEEREKKIQQEIDKRWKPGITA